jgi:hypothetical protein
LPGHWKIILEFPSGRLKFYVSFERNILMYIIVPISMDFRGGMDINLKS